MKRSTRVLASFVGTASVVLLAAAPAVVGAVSSSANTTVTANVGSTISLSTLGTVTMNITPTSAGSMSSSSDTVSVSTNNAAGYTLTMADADANTSLVSGANTIAADPGTQTTPSTTLTTNDWGYRVDGVGGFGAGPTAAETNVASSAYKWAGVPATGAPSTLKTTGTTASADPTIVWYGAKVTTAKPNGAYADTITYTATAN